MIDKTACRDVLSKGQGVLRMAPNWVPRPFNRPGRRLRLHPDDLFAMGMERGAIVERGVGSIDALPIKQAVERILEGGERAFQIRREKYGIK